MVLRLKVLRRQEQRINKVKELMNMYSINLKLNSNSYYQNQYQSIGAPSTSTTIDPKKEKVKGLMQMFSLTDRFQ